MRAAEMGFAMSMVKNQQILCAAFAAALLAGCEKAAESVAPAPAVVAPAPAPAETPPPRPADPAELSVGAVLNFDAPSASTALLTSGWSTPEAWGTWSNAKELTLDLPIAEVARGRALELEFAVVPFLSAPKVASQTVKVSVNGADAGSAVADKEGANTLLFKVPATATTTSPLKVVVSMPNAVAPVSIGVNPEARILGVGIRSVKLVSAS
jgi:hypothetical protein